MVVSAAGMRRADLRAASVGVSGRQLMATAGTQVARAVLRLMPGVKHALVLCGGGNNGGDGFVAAAALLSWGVDVAVVELPAAAAAHGDAGAARAEFLRAGGSAVSFTTAHAALAGLANPSLDRAVVVDALFGSGLSRPLEGELALLTAELATAAVPVLSVDVPSGLAADSAVPIGPHVRATATVELAARKRAGLFYPARAAYGQRELLPIGMPAALLEEVADAWIVTDSDVARWSPARSPWDHKYTAGTVTVVAGSANYPGAAELASRGAWRAGAGLVTLVSPALDPRPSTAGATRHASGTAAPAGGMPETIRMLFDWAAGVWPPERLALKHARSLVVGPGLDHAALSRLGELLAWAPGAVVLDAAALEPSALLAALPPGGPAALRPVVLTPHAGEAGRLIAALEDVQRASDGTADSAAAGGAGGGVTGGAAGDASAGAASGASAGTSGGTSGGARSGPEELLRRDPIAAATLLAAAFGSIVVLKGPATVIASPTGRVAVSTRGGPELASGGTGDVLAGAIGALLAAPSHVSPSVGQAGRASEAGDAGDADEVGAAGDAGETDHVDDAFERVAAAVWLHGRAGELAAAAGTAGRNAVLASEVADRLPDAWAEAHAGSRP